MFFLSFFYFCADIHRLCDCCAEYKLCSKHNVKKTYNVEQKKAAETTFLLCQVSRNMWV